MLPKKCLSPSTGGHTTLGILVSTVGALCFSSIGKIIPFPAILLCPSAEPGWAVRGSRAGCGTQDHVAMSPWLAPRAACQQPAQPGILSPACQCI